MQAFFWLVLEDRVFRAEPTNEIAPMEFEGFKIARLESPTITALATATFEPAEPAFTYCCETASFAAQMEFTLDKVPDAGLGIISTLQVDNYLLLINGSLVAGEGEMAPGRQTFHGQKTYITRIPSGLLQPGANQLTYITIRDGFPYTDIYPPIVAEYDSLHRFSARRLWVMSVFPLYGGLILAALGMVAAVLTMRESERRFGLWLSLVCTALAANALYGVVLDPPFGGYGRMLAFYLINLAAPTAVLGFIEAWSGRGSRLLLRLILPLYGLVVTVIAAMLALLPMPQAYDLPAQIWSWYHITFAMFALIRLVWHLAQMEDIHIVEGAILSVLVTTSIIDGLSLYFPEQRWMEGNLLHAAPFLMVAMVVAFVARNIRLFHSQAAIADMLRDEVRQREAELQLVYDRERVLLQAAAHDEERRRIMRDLHDGVGGQLMSLLLASRLGEVEPGSLASRLQSVMDEMRLMIDSMDSAGDSLNGALTSFRDRVSPRLAEAGIALDWQVSDVPDDFDYGPREILQVFRILQEAVTNVLRHANASRLTIALGADQVDGAVTISVTDNGRGVGRMSSVGKGVANMKRRAAAIDGELNIGPSEPAGTMVTLTLKRHSTAAGLPA